MIATVQRHGHAETLLREMYEPGQRDPHGIPHLITGSQEPASLEPERSSSGSRNIARLAGWLNELLAPSGQRRDQQVWHCTVRAHPHDRALADAQWALVAAGIMERTGLAARGDRRAVHWIAARHGRDHIHIIATLARQDGTIPRISRDAALAQNACHDAEDRYELRSTRPHQSSPAQAASPSRLACLSFPAPGHRPAPGGMPLDRGLAARPGPVPARPSAPRAAR
jgi:hypothetical protein